MPIDKQALKDMITLAKSEILDDISKGIVPADVASFDDLYEWVDANEYGFTSYDFDDYDTMIEYAEEFHPILDQWIKSGMPKEEN